MASRESFSPLRMLVVKLSNLAPMISTMFIFCSGYLVSTTEMMKSSASEIETEARNNIRDARKIFSALVDRCKTRSFRN